MFDKAVDHHNKNNREETWPIFRELAFSGHKDSLYYLGYYYEHGYVVPKDNKEGKGSTA
jgi:TPR repeat protein